MTKNSLTATFKNSPQKFHKALGVVLALLVVTSVAALGAWLINGGWAATGGTLTLTPATSTAASGSNFTLDLREASGSNAVNAVQASLTYDATKVQFVSISEGTVFTTSGATSTSTPGVIRVARGTAPSASISGDQKVLSVTFKLLASSGSTTIGIDKAFSNLALASDATDMLTTVTGATVNVQQTASGTLSLAPASGTYAPGAAIAVALNENSGTVAANAVQAHITYDPARLQFNSISNSSSFPNLGATDTSTPGVIRLARGTASGNTVTGTNTVATLNFTALTAGTSGTALGFNSTYSFIARASDSTNLLASTTGATYLISQTNPTISTVAPSAGTTAGGTVVTITGTNFVSGATVQIGGTAATGVTFVSSTTLRATTPAHTAGAVNVVVTNPGGTAVTKSAGFTYILPGDINGDTRVNAIDLSILITRDGQNYPPADFNSDGTVGAADLAILLSRWTW